jgi:hypothetical protein
VLPGTNKPAPASAVVTVNAAGQIANMAVGAVDGFAIYVGAKLP